MVQRHKNIFTSDSTFSWKFSFPALFCLDEVIRCSSRLFSCFLAVLLLLPSPASSAFLSASGGSLHGGTGVASFTASSMHKAFVPPTLCYLLHLSSEYVVFSLLNEDFINVLQYWCEWGQSDPFRWGQNISEGVEWLTFSRVAMSQSFHMKCHVLLSLASTAQAACCYSRKLEII